MYHRIFGAFESALGRLGPAFSRRKTFMWFRTLCLGLAVRPDGLGVTSVVRALDLDGRAYDALIRLFRSDAWRPGRLLREWCLAVRDMARPMTVNGRRVLAGDGVKVAKEGARMPGVKRMHQESGDSKKGEYVFGHLFGAVCAVAGAAGGGRSCVPLAAGIQDGMRATAGWEGPAFPAVSHVVQTAGCAHGCARHMGPCYLLLDRLFLTAPALGRLDELGRGGGPALVHVVTKAKSNCTAYLPPEPRPAGAPGRPRKRGAPVRLSDLFETAAAEFAEARVRVGDEVREARLLCRDLLWGQGPCRAVRFVLVECGGMRSVLATTDLDAAPEQVAELYGARFGIEHMFRSMNQDVQAFGYHFWTGSCPGPGRFARSGGPDRLESVTGARDRERVLECARAIERYVAASMVALGAMQLAACSTDPAGDAAFLEYRRTRRANRTTPRTVRGLMRKGVFSYIAGPGQTELTRFIRENMVGPGGYGAKRGA